MYDVTILYYTANVEDESFESKIRDNILANKRSIPLISVSQKPIDFGDNICVDIHDPCYFNQFRQILVGLKKVKTRYVLTAEADFLYPPDYFQFMPEEAGKCYRYFGVWVCYYLTKDKANPRFFFKGCSNGAQLIDKDLWAESLEKILKGRPEWTTRDDKPTKKDKNPIKTDYNYTWTGTPAITFKTRNNITPFTGIWKKVESQKDLPYWGNIKDLKKRMFE